MRKKQKQRRTQYMMDLKQDRILVEKYECFKLTDTFDYQSMWLRKPQTRNQLQRWIFQKV